MLNVALTGNIAAGKSSVAELFRRWGATVIDADAIVRELQAPGGEAHEAIVHRFGRGVLAADGTLDRPALRALVMADPAALADLNGIVHPAVYRRRRELLDEARARGDRIVVTDIPLLFEADDPARYDVVVLVDAPVPLRRARIVADRGLTPAEADRMIAAQMPAGPKRSRSDHIIDNDGDRRSLEGRARRVWTALETRAAA